MPRHFIDLLDLTPDEARTLIDRALQLKHAERQGNRPPLLSGRTLGLIFEKPSLRTRVSFESAIARLGGNAIFLRGEDVGLGTRESIEDFARVISQYVDALAVRTYAHATIEELGHASTIPIINALSDASHPCQAMADLMTIEELKGSPRGRKIVFVGDGNNVARSLAVACALLAAEFVHCGPAGFELPSEFQSQVRERFPAFKMASERDPKKAVAGADVLYTDVWTSMGQEHEAVKRREAFARYRVDEKLLALAKKDAVFLHCLPAHREEEVTSGVLDGPQSQILLQAANRMHFQMAMLVWLLGDGPTLNR